MCYCAAVHLEFMNDKYSLFIAIFKQFLYVNYCVSKLKMC